MAAVPEVDDEPDDQPDAEPQPVLRRQREHQQQAAEDAEDRHDRHERRTERPLQHRDGCCRMIRTAAQTITNANSVPMLTRSARILERQERRQRRPRRCRSGSSTSGACGSAGARRRRSPAAAGRRAPSPGGCAAWLSIITSSTDVMPATRADRDEELRPRAARPAEGVGDRRVDVDLVVGHHAGQHGGDGDVEDRAEQRATTMMPIGTSRCGLLGLLGVRRDRVEADVGEEDERGAGEHADRLAAGPVCPNSVWPKKLTPVSRTARTASSSPG